MSISDFQTFTEVDPSSTIEKTHYCTTLDNFNSRYEDAYVYKDMGVDHFDGDFTHYFEFTVVSGSECVLYLGQLQNIIDDTYGVYTAGNETSIGARLYNTGGTYKLSLIEINNGTMYGWSAFYSYTIGTTYYCKMVRDESIGSYGRATLYTHTNSDYTTPVSTLNLDLHEKVDFRYMYAVNGYNDGITGKIIGAHVKFFNIGEVVSVEVNRQNISDGSDWIENCGSLSGWTDQDSVGGVSTQAPFGFGGKPCFKLDSGPTPGSSTYAGVFKDVGSFSTNPKFSVGLYHGVLGTFLEEAFFYLRFDLTDTTSLRLLCVSDGFFVWDGDTWYEVGTNLVEIGEWQNWSFDVNSAAETVDVYLDGVVVGNDVDCSHTGSLTAGSVYFRQYSKTKANCLTYVDYGLCGDTLLSFVLAGTSFENEDCSVITDWTDVDNINGESVQAQFGGEECFEFMTHTHASDNYAWRRKNVGAFGDSIFISFSMYGVLPGAVATDDYWALFMERDDVSLYILGASDGLYIHDGASYVEVATDIVREEQWQEWTFEVDLTTPSSATVNVFLDGIIQERDVDCSRTGSYTDGRVDFALYGYGTDDLINHINWIRIGDAWGVLVSYSNPSPTDYTLEYTSSVNLQVTVGGGYPYYDIAFYNGDTDEVITTVTGVPDESEVSVYWNGVSGTVNGDFYSWYAGGSEAGVSGVLNYSDTYYFYRGFNFNGYVTVAGEAASRQVYLFRRSDAYIVGSGISCSVTGYFEIGSVYKDYHFVVILPELSDGYNLLGRDKLHPENY